MKGCIRFTKWFFVLLVAISIIGSHDLGISVVKAEQGEILDQRQAEHQPFFEGGEVSPWSSLAQSFIPRVSTLTRAGLLLYGNEVDPVTLTLSLRHSFAGANLTQAQTTLKNGTPPQWITFDFPDVPVTTEIQYLLVLTASAAYGGWSIGKNTNYTNGAAWWNQSYMTSGWELISQPGISSFDFCFETYGLGDGTIPATYVDDDFDETAPGMGFDHFTTIQEGIDAVSPQGTVHVSAGSYAESILINKGIVLQGSGNQTTFIEGTSSEQPAILITAEYVTMQGFSIRGSASYPIAVMLTSSHTTISHNVFPATNQIGIYSDSTSSRQNAMTENTIEAEDGIILISSSENVIRNNVFTCKGTAVSLDSSPDNVIDGNRITKENSGTAVSVFNDASSGNSITHNTISVNYVRPVETIYGISIYQASENDVSNNVITFLSGSDSGIKAGHSGIRLNRAHHTQVFSNTVTIFDCGLSISYSDSCFVENNQLSNGTYGLYILSNISQFKGNRIHHVDTGIFIGYSHFLSFENNTIRDTYCWIENEASTSNTFFHNNFINSTIYQYQGSPENHNTWNLSYPRGGNYWDDYTGVDADGDGIGDSPYSISGSSDHDFLPFMSQDRWKKILTIQASGQVTENQIFEVVITYQGTPVSQAFVNFSGTTYRTDAHGRAVLTAPQVSSDTYFLLTVYKADYEQSQMQILVLNHELGDEGTLIITTVSTIIENQQFTVTVTSSKGGFKVAGVDVTFNGLTQQTDSTGTVLFIAPMVDATTIFIIAAYHLDYGFVTKTLTVLNNLGSGEENGWVYGIITDENSVPLADVTIYVTPSSIGILTNEQGAYSLTLPAQTYRFTASKNGYKTSVKTEIVVQQSNVSEVNFVLIKNLNDKQKNTSHPIDYALRYAIGKGIVGGQIEIIADENDGSSLYSAVIRYDPSVDFTITTMTASSFTFIVNGTQNSTGKIIAVRFGPGTLQDMKNITIVYDNVSISWVDFDTLFEAHPEAEVTNASWTSVLAIDKKGEEILYCLIHVPHFSEHTISIQTITSIIEGLSTTLAVVLFVFVFLILGVFYFLPYFYVRVRKNK